MKKPTILLLFTAIFSLFSCNKAPDVPKISIFCDHIESIARQERISFAQAATLLKECGYTGVDVRVFQRPEEIKTLDSLGFEHACAITEIDYSQEDQSQLEEQTLQFMDTQGYDRLLLVTGLMPESGFSQEQREAARKRIAAFAARVTAKGYTVMVEDYDIKDLPVKELINYCKYMAGNSNPQVRTSATNLICTIYKYVGEDVKVLIKDDENEKTIPMGIGSRPRNMPAAMHNLMYESCSSRRRGQAVCLR